MLSLLAGFISAAVTPCSLDELPQKLEKSPHTIVFFRTTDKSRDSDTLKNTLVKVSEATPSLLYLEVTVSSPFDTVEQYNIKATPSIVFFKGSKNLGTYSGAADQDKITKIVSKFISAGQTPLEIFDNIMDYYDFINQNPSSAIIYAKSEDMFTRKISRAISDFDATIAVSLVQNSEMARALGFSTPDSVMINRPYDGFSRVYRHVKEEEVISHLRPFIHVTYDEASFGHRGEGFVIGAVIQRNNPHHRNEVSDCFKQVAQIFGRKFGYHVVDYENARTLTDKFTIINRSVPSYFITYSDDQGSVSSYFNSYDRTPGMIRSWARTVLGDLPEKREAYRKRADLKSMAGPEFENAFRAAISDDFVLMGDMSLPGYTEALDLFAQLPEIFTGTHDIHFYQYNPYVQLNPFVPIQYPCTNRTIVRYYKSAMFEKEYDFKVPSTLKKLLLLVMKRLDKVIEEGPRAKIGAIINDNF